MAVLMDAFYSYYNFIVLGLETALQPYNLMFCFVGVLLGTFVGVLPGIGALTAIALLLPVTFHLESTAAIVMLAGVFYGTTYGGSTASILLNLPGTPSSAVTSLDGYPMSKQGRAGVALLMTTVASFAGGSIGILAMMFFAPAISQFAIDFGPAESFTMMLLGMVAASTISTGSALKGVAMVVLGVLFGLVGADTQTGIARFTFGFIELFEGISLVAIAMGLFGLAEVIGSVGQARRKAFDAKSITFRSMVPTPDDRRRSVFPILRGAGIGSMLGALPGVGGILSSFMAYAVEKRLAKDPSRFGKGAIEGIMAPEAANNAADQTAFIPTMTLGIPGNVITALLIGALTIHGIVPGPLLMVEQPSLFWGLIMSFWIGNIMLVILNIPLIGVWLKVLLVPFHILYPAILMFVCVGVFSLHNSYFDVLVVAAFGVTAYVMRSLDFHVAPLLLGFVLGPLLEENFQRALLMNRGNFETFITGPICIIFVGLTILLLVWPIVDALRRYRTSPR